MQYLAKKFLYIDLAKKEAEVKSFPDLYIYLGGVGVGLKLYEMNEKQDPLVFSVGPLNGFFPFVSKTAVVLSSDNDGSPAYQEQLGAPSFEPSTSVVDKETQSKVEDVYFGGTLSYRIRFAGVDGIVFFGKASEPLCINIVDDKVEFMPSYAAITNLGLPGKRSVLKFEKDRLVLDDFFLSYDNLVGKKFTEKNLDCVAITGTRIFPIENPAKYEALYKDILYMGCGDTLYQFLNGGKNLPQKNLEVTPGRTSSCSGCPLGCEEAKIGELGGNVLTHCLVACDFAKDLYSDASIVFSCLNVLGYDYKHEDIEKVPALVEGLLRRI